MRRYAPSEGHHHFAAENQWDVTAEISSFTPDLEFYSIDEAFLGLGGFEHRLETHSRAAAGKNAVIPPKANRKVQRSYDRDIYMMRHLIENFFARLKQFRAIATRYDKTARNFLGAIHLAAAVTWLN